MKERAVDEIIAKAISNLGIRVDFSKEYGRTGSRIKVKVRLLNYHGDTIAEDDSWIPVEEFR